MSLTLQKILAGVLFALMLIKGMDLIINDFMPVEVEQAASKGGAVAVAAAAPAPEKPLPARLAAADPKKGEQESSKCASCHTFNPGGPVRVGPNLAGVVGRDKASVAGFSYSDALKKVGGKWDYESLDKWLEKPAAFASGTKMTFAGLSDGQDRADLIAYLKSISPDAPPFPK
ncbi:MAG TPA: cytochrome c family protein [Magnetospirillaceae bacterium]|jgi:cytochrome c